MLLVAVACPGPVLASTDSTKSFAAGIPGPESWVNMSLTGSWAEDAVRSQHGEAQMGFPLAETGGGVSSHGALAVALGASYGCASPACYSMPLGGSKSAWMVGGKSQTWRYTERSPNCGGLLPHRPAAARAGPGPC